LRVSLLRAFFTGNALKKQGDKGNSFAERSSFSSREMVNCPVSLSALSNLRLLRLFFFLATMVQF